MKNPCRRDCPDRAPGCDCEKRRAWKYLREQAKEALRLEHEVEDYRTSSIRRRMRRRKFNDNKRRP